MAYNEATTKEKTMKTAYRKVRKFMADHEEGIFMATVAITATAATVAAVYIADAERKQQKEINEWTKKQNFSGHAVYQLADGSYLAVSQDQVS